MSIADGFLNAAQKTVAEYGANAMQIFLKSPRGRSEKPLDLKEAEEFKKYCRAHGVFVVGHCSYLLNFAKDLSADPWPLDSLISDLHKIKQLGGGGVVLHLGKYLELDKATALKFMAKNIGEVLNRTKNGWIILENTAGQGSEIGWRFEELAKLYGKLGKPTRVKFCLDTAHAFAAGYELSTPVSVKKTLAEFDRLIGLKNLICLHLNDTFKTLGSRVDRHENIGKGLIGKAGLLAIIKLAQQRSWPMILETPECGTGSHLQDLRTIRAWLKSGKQ
jgi:deoxyribonuclease-4